MSQPEGNNDAEGLLQHQYGRTTPDLFSASIRHRGEATDFWRANYF
jgi:hypothetical protein